MPPLADIIINFMFVLAFGVAFFAIYYDDDGLDCGMQLEDDQKWLATNFHGSETGFFTNIYKMLQFDQIAWFHDRSAGLFFLLPLLGTSLTGDVRPAHRTPHSAPTLLLALRLWLVAATRSCERRTSSIACAKEASITA